MAPLPALDVRALGGHGLTRHSGLLEAAEVILPGGHRGLHAQHTRRKNLRRAAACGTWRAVTSIET